MGHCKQEEARGGQHNLGRGGGGASYGGDSTQMKRDKNETTGVIHVQIRPRVAKLSSLCSHVYKCVE